MAYVQNPIPYKDLVVDIPKPKSLKDHTYEHPETAAAKAVIAGAEKHFQADITDIKPELALENLDNKIIRLGLDSLDVENEISRIVGHKFLQKESQSTLYNHGGQGEGNHGLGKSINTNQIQTLKETISTVIAKEHIRDLEKEHKVKCFAKDLPFSTLVRSAGKLRKRCEGRMVDADEVVAEVGRIRLDRLGILG